MKLIKNIIVAIALLYTGAWIGTTKLNLGRDYAFKKAKACIVWFKNIGNEDEGKDVQHSNRQS